MSNRDISRRNVLKGGGAALVGLTVMRVAGPAHAFPGRPGYRERVPWSDEPSYSAQGIVPPAGQVIRWVDQPPPNPVPQITGNLLQWEALDSYLTPARDFFYVQHYGQPEGLDEATWRVGIGGLVARPQSLALADLKARPLHEVNFTLECSGNADTSSEFFFGGIGTARWGGARLAPLLEAAGVLPGATEVVFWGADKGPVTIGDNIGILSGGRTGTVEPNSGGGLDLTITEQFARSMSLDDALNEDNLLCYRMNGEALPPKNGFPVRLIAPGFYGVANVKWLTRIEVTDRRFAGRFMAREYVQVREEERDGQAVWTFTTVGPVRLKSAPARVTREGNRYMIAGAAWGAPVAAVQVRIDGGPWMPADLTASGGQSSCPAGSPASPQPAPFFVPTADCLGWVPNNHPLAAGRDTSASSGYAWRFWTFDWGTPSPGEHLVASRAFDTSGNVQPAPEDPVLASKRTYWESNGHITRRVLIP